MEITYGGMAGGPVWYTDVYGFLNSVARSDLWRSHFHYPLASLIDRTLIPSTTGLRWTRLNVQLT
jgi:hypothetical protein